MYRIVRRNTNIYFHILKRCRLWKYIIKGNKYMLLLLANIMVVDELAHLVKHFPLKNCRLWNGGHFIWIASTLLGIRCLICIKLPTIFADTIHKILQGTLWVYISGCFTLTSFSPILLSIFTIFEIKYIEVIKISNPSIVLEHALNQNHFTGNRLNVSFPTHLILTSMTINLLIHWDMVWVDVDVKYRS